MSVIRIANVGCGHGALNAIYEGVKAEQIKKGWDTVDCVIIGGDFQALRNANDVACISMPPKYRKMGDFHEYYSGKRVAPYLTIFCGGNHEASNYLYELYHGGWVAPNIYYLGAANVVNLGPIRIAGMSGIFKGFDYRRPHFERLPYNSEDVKSIYHVRELDTRKLMQLRTPVDICISHDWPSGIEKHGDIEELFKKKMHLRSDSDSGKLGNPAAAELLERVRPRYWLSAHLHTRFALTMAHDNTPLRKRKRVCDEPDEWQYETYEPAAEVVIPVASKSGEKSPSPGPSMSKEDAFMKHAREVVAARNAGKPIPTAGTGVGAWNTFSTSCAQADAANSKAKRAAFNDPSRSHTTRSDFQTSWTQVKTSDNGDRTLVAAKDTNQVQNTDEIDIDMASGSEASPPPAKRPMTSKVTNNDEISVHSSADDKETDTASPGPSMSMEDAFMKHAREVVAARNAGKPIPTAGTGLGAWNTFPTSCAQADAANFKAKRAAFNDPSRSHTTRSDFQTSWAQVKTSDNGDRTLVAAKDANQVQNTDEINIDMASGSEASPPPTKPDMTSDVTKDDAPAADLSTENKETDEMRSKLPASLARRVQRESHKKVVPEAITNKMTKFMALDKPAGRDPHLELFEVQPLSDTTENEMQRPLRLKYDKEWLAITRVFANELELNNKQASVPRSQNEEVYLQAIKGAEDSVEENVVKDGKTDVPENFVPVAPHYDPALPLLGVDNPPEYPNPQTQAYCDLLGIPNKFALTDEEIEQRLAAGPPPLTRPDFDAERRRGSRGGHRRGRGKGKRGGQNAQQQS